MDNYAYWTIDRDHHVQTTCGARRAFLYRRCRGVPSGAITQRNWYPCLPSRSHLICWLSGYNVRVKVPFVTQQIHKKMHRISQRKTGKTVGLPVLYLLFVICWPPPPTPPFFLRDNGLWWHCSHRMRTHLRIGVASGPAISGLLGRYVLCSNYY